MIKRVLFYYPWFFANYSDQISDFCISRIFSRVSLIAELLEAAWANSWTNEGGLNMRCQSAQFSSRSGYSQIRIRAPGR